MLSANCLTILSGVRAKKSMTNRHLIGAHLLEAADLCAVIAADAKKLLDGPEADLAKEILAKNIQVHSEIQMAGMAMNFEIKDLPA